MFHAGCFRLDATCGTGQGHGDATVVLSYAALTLVNTVETERGSITFASGRLPERAREARSPVAPLRQRVTEAARRGPGGVALVLGVAGDHRDRRDRGGPPSWER